MDAGLARGIPGSGIGQAPGPAYSAAMEEQAAMASTTSKAGQNGPASASQLDEILRLLVTRPGRRRQDRQALRDLAWLVNFAAGTFEGDPGEGTWPTLDMVACGAENSGETLDPDRVVDNIRFLPPLLGFVDKAERVGRPPWRFRAG